MTLTRRRFIRNVSVAGGALSIGISLSACNSEQPNLGGPTDFEPNAWLQLAQDGTVTLQLPKAEMGQGVYTGLTTLVAEELELEPARIHIEMAPVHGAFVDPEYNTQVTGGSNSMRVHWELLRRAAASARETLIAAAAADSSHPPALLFASDGEVRSRDGGYVASYGQLVPRARQLPVPEEVALKTTGQFRLIGKFNRRLDAASKSDGTAVFGIDVAPADAATAVVIRSPAFGGTLVDFDASAAMEIEGIVDIFPIERGVAVVAEGYWPARRAADLIQANFLPPQTELHSSEDIERAMREALDGEEFATVRDDPPTRDHAAAEGQVVEAEYRVPFLAHATMEPQNATAWYRDGVCDLWLGTQSPDLARAAAASVLGCDTGAVRVHNQFLGGGFGRRSMPDAAAEVAAIAARIDRPVKLVWSREDDTRHDYYRPAMAGQLRATVAEDGSVSGWRHRIVGPSIMQQIIPEMGGVLMPGWVPGGVLDFAGKWAGREDKASVEGARELPYLYDGIEVQYRNLPTPVPLGYWRSVGHSHTAFVVESFVDELAAAAAEDPLAFRLRHLHTDSRERRVLEEVARMARWGKPPEGRFHGVAVHESFHSVVAEVAEISLAGGKLRVERFFCAVDCGLVVNPDIARDQIEGGVAFALAAALHGEITLERGAVAQGNFHDYPVLRHDEMPLVEVAFIPSDEPPRGVGEPGVPPAAPALANALFAATGVRARRLPLGRAAFGRAAEGQA